MRGIFPPQLIAQLDQDNAAVDDLVRQVQAHWANCFLAGECPGDDVVLYLADRSPAQRTQLLIAALVRLAQTTGHPVGQHIIEEGTA